MSDVTAETMNSGPLLAADGTPLKKKLAQTTRRAKIRALMLTAPLVIFLMVGFVIPIGQMLYRSAHNDAFSRVMPNLAEALLEWDGEGVPERKSSRSPSPTSSRPARIAPSAGRRRG